METTEQSESLMDCEVEVAVADSPEQERDFSADGEQVCLETDSSDSCGGNMMLGTLITDLPAGTVEIDEPDCLESTACTEIPCQDQKEALIIEPQHEELNRNESVTSSVSDTLSSADSVYENEAHPKRQDTPERDPEPEPEVDDNEPDPVDDGYQNLEIDTEEEPIAHEILFEPPITDESVVEQCIREEAMSDVSNESCHDLDPEDMDECLRVEIAAASSDSDTDEKWRSIFSSSINKEDDDSYLDSLQLSAQELFVQKIEVTDCEEQQDNNFEEVQFEVPQVEEVLEQPDDFISFPVPPQEVTPNPVVSEGLSKLSEDESENGEDNNHNHSTHQQHSQHFNSDPSKKLPKDFCVIQETKSENVSTEHVDFQLARKQWRQMEEQTKNQIVLPTTKQSNFHGSHSFMYTPVRNIERPQKKVYELENLNQLGDYPHTQFSPCSEDSGLDDSSYRSPYDDLETPVEKEIRIAMERDDNYRRERGLSKMGKSTDCNPSRSMPRSISTPLTPSFIITSSPTKEPLKHEVSANNVIILEPSNDFTSSPRHGKEAAASQWRSEDNSSCLIILETSNLIIRSASEFSLSKAFEQPQEKMFLSNPFFKLRSRSSVSLVDEEIKMVKQREEELKKEQANRKDMMLPNHMDSLTFDDSGMLNTDCKTKHQNYTEFYILLVYF